MYMNMKQGRCYKCNEQLKIPIAQCFTQCHSCNKMNIFLCHVIKKQPNINKHRLQCQQCKQIYSIINCPKCKGYCGIKNFMNGFSYECLCKYRATYLACNKCKTMLALPVDKQFQKIKLRCKCCFHQFRYKICGTCRSCIYKNGDDNNDIYLCHDKQCPQSGSGNLGSLNLFNSDNKQVKEQINYRISQFQQQVKNQQLSFKDLCKVCIDKQATMINTKCYHLALCETCAALIIRQRDGQCPICRTKSTYKKVFKP